MGFLSGVTKILGGGGGLGGAALGGLAGLALAPATGGASLLYGLGGAALGGSLGGGMAAASGAEKAGELQSEAAQAGVAEQRRQFDLAMETLSPYSQAGVTAMTGLAPYAAAGAPALEAQQALAGLKGPAAQRAAIANIEQSPEFQAYARQGEEAMLQRASATGGLRGGNIQGALAQFRPQLLSNLINEQYGRLGGLTQLGSQTTSNIAQLGQAAAAGQASGALRTGETIAGLLGQAGAAQAGAAMAPAQAFQQTFGNLLGLGGTYIGGKALGVF